MTPSVSRSLQLWLKHAIDRVVAMLLLLLLAPVLLIIVVLICMEDRHPAIFRQRRPGRGGVPFHIWKFRTMVPDADNLLQSGAPVRARITRTGRVLRYASIDELPQLINIVRGEMSFVGPRPGLLEHWERYTSEQRRRYDMKPGITGLAQVRGRNTLLWSERIRLDLEYIDNFTLWLDLRILARTVVVVLTGKGIVIDRNSQQVDDLSPPRRQ